MFNTCYYGRCEKRANSNQTDGMYVNLDEEGPSEDNDGGRMFEDIPGMDKSLGPPFGIVLNGHSLVSSRVNVIYVPQWRV